MCKMIKITRPVCDYVLIFITARLISRSGCFAGIIESIPLIYIVNKTFIGVMTKIISIIMLCVGP